MVTFGANTVILFYCGINLIQANNREAGGRKRERERERKKNPGRKVISIDDSGSISNVERNNV